MKITGTAPQWKALLAVMTDDKMAYSGATGRLARGLVAVVTPIAGDSGPLDFVHSIDVDEGAKKFLRELDVQVKRPMSIEIEIGPILDQVR